MWRTASGPGDCSWNPMDLEIDDDEELETAEEPEIFDDEEE